MEEFSWTDSMEELVFSERDERDEDTVHILNCTSAIDAINKYLNLYGKIGDLRTVSKHTGILLEDLLQLRGKMIFQDPMFFLDKPNTFNVYEGYVLRDEFLEGDTFVKLQAAKKLEKMIPGCFTDHVDALENLLPEETSLNDIYIGLGAPFIPADVIEDFVYKLLHLEVHIRYYETLSRWDLRLSDDDKEKAKNSKLNRVIYGTFSMDALNLIYHDLNGMEVNVYEPTGMKGKQRHNHLLEQEARNKLQLIREKFQEFIDNLPEPDRESLMTSYIRSLGAYHSASWDTSWYQLLDISAEINIYDYHKNHIARCSMTDQNRLICEPAGSGKTYEIIGIAHDRKRVGRSNKTIIVVKNGLLEEITATHRKMYPGDRFLKVVPEKDFSPRNREETLREIAENGDQYVCIYLTHSSFDMIKISLGYKIEKQKRIIRELSKLILQSSDRREKDKYASERRKHKKILFNLMLENEYDGLCYDDLGVDLLIVDEAQYYKNVPVTSRHVEYLKTGSTKCIEMLDKVHSTKMTVFLTATPMTNSFTELHGLMQYLMPDVLKQHQLSSFDMWLNTYASAQQCIETDFTGTRLHIREKYDKFHNLSSMMQMFSSVLLYYAPSEEELHLPAFKGYIDVEIPKGPKAKEYEAEYALRADAITSGKVSPTKDNILKLNMDMHLGNLDPRCREKEPDAPEFRKTHHCDRKVKEVYDLYPECCQIVFCDIGVPKTSFNLYDEMKMELINLGIPEKEIAFVHDAVNNAARTKLFKQVNDGKIKILIGSTDKLGVGVNIQRKLKAIHHLSVPWRPSDIEQRNGRLIRNGNENEEVLIFRYFMVGTYDAYLWQMQERKARQINQLLSGVIGVREIEDLDMVVLSAAEIKALSIGNPLIKTRMETANELERAQMAQRAQIRERKELESFLKTAQNKIDNLHLRAEQAEQDYEWFISTREPLGKEERRAFGEELLGAIADNRYLERERQFDQYQGFDVLLPSMMSPDKPYIYLRGREGTKYYLEMQTDKPMGCSQRIDHFLNDLGAYSSSLLDQAEGLEYQKKQSEEHLKCAPNSQNEVMMLKEKLKQIDQQIIAQGKGVFK